MKKLIIILTYNEAENIRDVIEAVNRETPGADILIVDDNSPDGTGEMVDDLIRSDIYSGQLYVIHRPCKLGVASGYVDAYHWAFERGYEVCMEFDADFSHDLSAIEPMFEAMTDYDLLIGSRYVRGGNIKNWDWKRRFLSYWGNIYERVVLFSGIHDLSGGMNCYRTDLLKDIKLDTLISQGYLFHAECKFRAMLLNAHIGEYPICFTDRVKGKSKLNSSILKEVLFGIVRLSLSRWKIKKIMGLKYD